MFYRIAFVALALVPVPAPAQTAPTPARAAPAQVEVAVLARPVQRGEILSADDFVYEKRSPNMGRGAIEADAAKGLEAVRPLSPGSVVRISDVMHRGDALPTVPATATLAAALLEMSRKRLGMTAILNEDG